MSGYSRETKREIERETPFIADQMWRGSEREGPIQTRTPNNEYDNGYLLCGTAAKGTVADGGKCASARRICAMWTCGHSISSTPVLSMEEFWTY